MKICPLGAEFFHADVRTIMTKLIVTFRTFVTSPKKGHVNTAEGREQLSTPHLAGSLKCERSVIRPFLPQRPVRTRYFTGEYTDRQLEYRQVLHFPQDICSMWQQDADVCILQRHCRLRLFVH